MDIGQRADREEAVAPAPPGSRRDLPAALAVVTGSVPLGALLGVLWWAVSPPVRLVVTAAGPALADAGSDELFAVDGTFALLGAGLGLLSGVAVWFAARRWRGPVLMAGLVLGGLLGGLVAWQLGRQIGLSHYHALLHSTEVGRRFTKPVDLRSNVALVPWPFFALAGYLVLAAWVARPDLGREPARRPDALS